MPELRFVNRYHDEPGYIAALADQALANARSEVEAVNVVEDDALHIFVADFVGKSVAAQQQNVVALRIEARGNGIDFVLRAESLENHVL